MMHILFGVVILVWGFVAGWIIGVTVWEKKGLFKGTSHIGEKTEEPTTK